MEDAPGTQRHRDGPDPEHRPRTLAEDERRYVPEFDAQFFYAFKNRDARLVVTRLPSGRCIGAKQADLDFRGCRIDEESGKMSADLTEAWHLRRDETPALPSLQAHRIGIDRSTCRRSVADSLTQNRPAISAVNVQLNNVSATRKS